MIKQFILILPIILLLASCSGFNDDLAKNDFLKTCNGCKVVEVVSEECQDGSILTCMLVKINYTQGNDSLKSVMCQYIKGDNGEWHLVE